MIIKNCFGFNIKIYLEKIVSFFLLVYDITQIILYTNQKQCDVSIICNSAKINECVSTLNVIKFPFLHELLLIRVTHANFLLSTTSEALDIVIRQTQHATKT
jgi:hypothetical protein